MLKKQKQIQNGSFTVKDGLEISVQSKFELL